MDRRLVTASKNGALGDSEEDICLKLSWLDEEEMCERWEELRMKAQAKAAKPRIL